MKMQDLGNFFEIIYKINYIRRYMYIYTRIAKEEFNSVS